jgi:hypothetical protein
MKNLIVRTVSLVSVVGFASAVGCAAPAEDAAQSDDALSTQATETISCASNGYQYAVCQSGMQSIRWIRLLHQDSSSPCTEGSSYGHYDDAIWVDHGCRGTFQVGGGYGGPGGRVELFDRNGFSGGEYVVTGTITNFDPLGYNDRARSMVVQSGNWLVCQHMDFGGLCQSYGPGSYEDLGALDNQISSIRPL